ncbi:MAG: tetratricopeptide repeat protein [candidate division KSB1 bacterium]|nr:tetratricopeptide repeat protein [candidate division KSB1 bacterium]MDQ7063129.1 tetratricopeptide repeat protein [candidate division KSB1 bacterium]
MVHISKLWLRHADCLVDKPAIDLGEHQGGGCMYFIATVMGALALFAYLAYFAYHQENYRLFAVNMLLGLVTLIGLILELLNRSSREEIFILGLLVLAGLITNAYFLVNDRISVYSHFYRSALKSLPPACDQDQYEAIFCLRHREFLRAIDVFPETKEKEQLWHHWLQGMTLLRNQRMDEALHEFLRIHDWIVLPEVMLNIGAILIEKNMPREALNYFDEIEKHFEPDALLFYNKGLALSKLGQLTEANAYYERLQERPLALWKVPFMHGKLLRRMGQNEKAITLFLQAARLAPTNAKIWAYIAILHSKQGQPERALLALDQALRINDQDAMLWYNRGNMLVKMKDYASAIRSYDRALEINPGFIRAWNNKGIALTRLGKTEEAIQCYRHALSFESRYHEALLNCALALDTLHRTNEAVDYYRRFLQCAPAELRDHIAHVRRRLHELSAHTTARTPHMMKVA